MKKRIFKKQIKRCIPRNFSLDCGCTSHKTYWRCRNCFARQSHLNFDHLKFRAFDRKTQRFLPDSEEWFASVNHLRSASCEFLNSGDYLILQCSGCRDLNNDLIYAGDFLQTDEGNWRAYVICGNYFMLVDNGWGFSAMPNWHECKIIGRDTDLKRLEANHGYFKFRVFNPKEHCFFPEHEELFLSSHGNKVISADGNEYSLAELAIELWTGWEDIDGIPIYEGDIVMTEKDRKPKVVVFRNGSFFMEEIKNNRQCSSGWRENRIISNIHGRRAFRENQKNEFLTFLDFMLKNAFYIGEKDESI